jgi:lipopolysaccharide/colanic/teichoic acid biosynthesis glycosyltransferase
MTEAERSIQVASLTRFPAGSGELAMSPFPRSIAAAERSDPLRRAFDIAFALIGCQVFAPFFAVAAALIKLEDGGPVLFRQERIGKDRRTFSILKLRTMRGGKVTRVGKWLRATGLDETTQFFNVLLGDMSMVGPRPLTREDVERLGWTGLDARWEVKPGITGLAQLFGGTAKKSSLRLDNIYRKRRSAWLDTQIIAASFIVNIAGKQRTKRWLRELRAASRKRNRRSHAAPFH